MKIKAWHIGIVWEDDTEEVLANIPNWLAKRVDKFLDELEEEYDEQFITRKLRKHTLCITRTTTGV